VSIVQTVTDIFHPLKKVLLLILVVGFIVELNIDNLGAEDVGKKNEKKKDYCVKRFTNQIFHYLIIIINNHRIVLKKI